MQLEQRTKLFICQVCGIRRHGGVIELHVNIATQLYLSTYVPNERVIPPTNCASGRHAVSVSEYAGPVTMAGHPPALLLANRLSSERPLRCVSAPNDLSDAAPNRYQGEKGLPPTGVVIAACDRAAVLNFYWASLDI